MALLGQGLRDVFHHPHHTIGAIADLVNRLAALFGQRQAGFDAGNRLFHIAARRFGAILDLVDHAGNFLGSGSGAFRQLAYLVGHHGKATAHLARPRRLNGGVQRQQVGLVGDVLDHLHDGRNGLCLAHQIANGAGGLIHRTIDTLHLGYRTGDHFAALIGQLPGAGRHLTRMLGQVGNLLDAGRHLFDGGRHFGGGVALLVGTAGNRSGGTRDVACHTTKRLAATSNPAHQFPQVLLHIGHRSQQAVGIPCSNRHLHVQIPLSDTMHYVARQGRFAAQLLHDVASDQVAHHDHDRNRQQHFGDQHISLAQEAALHIIKINTGP